MCQYSQNQESSMNQSSQQEGGKMYGKDSANRRNESMQKKTIYMARFVKENFGDRHKVRPNERFVKVWTFRNNGETDWPSDTLFIQTNGDNLEAQPQ